MDLKTPRLSLKGIPSAGVLEWECSESCHSLLCTSWLWIYMTSCLQWIQCEQLPLLDTVWPASSIGYNVTRHLHWIQCDQLPPLDKMWTAACIGYSVISCLKFLPPWLSIMLHYSFKQWEIKQIFLSSVCLCFAFSHRKIKSNNIEIMDGEIPSLFFPLVI